MRNFLIQLQYFIEVQYIIGRKTAEYEGITVLALWHLHIALQSMCNMLRLVQCFGLPVRTAGCTAN